MTCAPVSRCRQVPAEERRRARRRWRSAGRRGRADRRSATTIEAARAAFGDLSTALIAYADTTKQPIEGKIVAFCPMVNKSWVQTDGAIANPYYGKAMTTCGSSTRKLSATH